MNQKQQIPHPGLPRTDLSVLIVDDAKFSSAMITKTLKTAGYMNLFHASSAREAIAVVEKEPVSVVIADWMMPEMDGLELTRQIRLIDEAENRYTYVIMLTALEGMDALAHAFDEGVDDFVNKAVMNQQLIPRVLAAERIARIQNRVLQENQMLIGENARLQQMSTIDPLTGLPNRRQAMQVLEDTLRQCQARGGITCFILIDLHNLGALRGKHSEATVDQLVVGVGRRLRQLVRPLDTVARITESEFALITHMVDASHCTATSFRRLHEGMNLKAYKTSSHYLTLEASISMAFAEHNAGIEAAEGIIELARRYLTEARGANRVVAHRWLSEEQLQQG